MTFKESKQLFYTLSLYDKKAINDHKPKTVVIFFRSHSNLQDKFTNISVHILLHTGHDLIPKENSVRQSFFLKSEFHISKVKVIMSVKIKNGISVSHLSFYFPIFPDNF